MARTVLVQVPPGEAADLLELDATAPAAETRPFDGAAMVQIIYVLGPGSLTALIAWIQARASSRKHFKIVVDGIEMNGYSAREAERIVGELAKIANDREQDADES